MSMPSNEMERVRQWKSPAPAVKPAIAWDAPRTSWTPAQGLLIPVEEFNKAVKGRHFAAGITFVRVGGHTQVCGKSL